MLSEYETPVTALALPEMLTVGCDRLTVTACVALAVVVLVSVAVTVMVGEPAVVKVCAALVAETERLSSALPSPQSTFKLESVEPAAGVAVMPSEYETPVFAVVLPETVSVGCDKLTVTAWVALAVAVLASVAVTVIVREPAVLKVWVAPVALFAKVCSALPSPQFTFNSERLELGAEAAVMPSE